MGAGLCHFVYFIFLFLFLIIFIKQTERVITKIYENTHKILIKFRYLKLITLKRLTFFETCFKLYVRPPLNLEKAFKVHLNHFHSEF